MSSIWPRSLRTGRIGTLCLGQSTIHFYIGVSARARRKDDLRPFSVGGRVSFPSGRFSAAGYGAESGKL
jgi:hypothetical protein